MTKDSMIKYQESVKAEMVKYLSDQNPNNPKPLFKIESESVLNSVITTGLDTTRSTCENLLVFFINKTDALRASISSSDPVPDDITPPPLVHHLSGFAPAVYHYLVWWI